MPTQGRSLHFAGACLIICLSAAANLFAGDYATLNFIGFSSDGRYLAFEEYGVQDGSGFPYSNIYFIDTAKNVYAAPPAKAFLKDEMASINTARGRSASHAAKKLKQYGIVKGNTGKHVISHLINDLTVSEMSDGEAPIAVQFAETIGSMYKRGHFELVLRPEKNMPKDCEAFEQEMFMLDLKLVNRDYDSTTVLQQDAALPASRGCALGYRFQDVYLHKGVIVVFLNVFTTGFEGPDMRFMAVTGPLK